MLALGYPASPVGGHLLGPVPANDMALDGVDDQAASRTVTRLPNRRMFPECPLSAGHGQLNTPNTSAPHTRTWLGRSRTVAGVGERRSALLESVLGATPQEFESPILRHTDLRKRDHPAP